MQRRFFLKSISLVTAAVLLPSLMTGCHQDDLKTKDKISIKEALLKHTAGVAVIDGIIMKHKKSINDFEDYNYLLKNDEDRSSLETILTLPWFMGPKIQMDKDDYALAKYSNSNLIFSGYGISTRVKEISSKLKNKTLDGYKEEDKKLVLSTEKILVDLGMKSEKELYLYIFDKLTSYQASEVYVMLDYLNTKGVINIEKLLNTDYLNESNERLISYMYNNYISYEDNKEDTYPKDSWGFRDLHTGQWVTLNKNDFMPYTFTFLVMNSIIASDGSLINGI